MRSKGSDSPRGRGVLVVRDFVTQKGENKGRRERCRPRAWEKRSPPWGGEYARPNEPWGAGRATLYLHPSLLRWPIVEGSRGVLLSPPILSRESPRPHKDICVAFFSGEKFL